MPNRILRDGILSSERVDLLGYAEEVFFRRLQSAVDDHGRFHGNPKLIRAACYPLRLDTVSDSDIVKWVASCSEAGLTKEYLAADGKKYIEIINFGQRVQAKSKFPDPREEVVHGEQPCSTVENRLVGDVVGDVVEGVGVVSRTKARFTPPTVEQVAEYIRERRSTIDAEAFVSHYEAVGWFVGKKRMVDWRAAVRTWEAREKRDGSHRSATTNDQPSPAALRPL